jgi:hypothetical protein
MKVIAYLQRTLDVKAVELMQFKKELTPEDWEVLKYDARKEALAKGIELED